MVATPDTAIDKLTFYRGVLYSLRLRLEDGVKFYTHDKSYHRAFGSAMRYALATWPTNAGAPIEMHENPIFGEYDEAREMLLEGEQDRLLSLMNPRLQKGSFTISKEDAEEELNELPYASWFQEIASRLAKELRPA